MSRAVVYRSMARLASALRQMRSSSLGTESQSVEEVSDREHDQLNNSD